MIDERLANNFKTRPEFRQANRKCNDIVQAMYAMYLTGKSIAEVARVYRKTRQAVFDQFRVRGFKMRSKPLRGLTILHGYQFTLTKGGYLRGTVDDERMLAQQFVWIMNCGPIPKGYCVRHVNADKTDNRKENLEMMPIKEFARNYGSHMNQFTSPNGSQRKKGDRIRAEREERYRRAMLI